MADTKISALMSGTPSLDDLIPYVDDPIGGPITKKMQVVNLLAMLYPVGSVYINASDSTNPATLLGFGTWAAFGVGRVMVGLNALDTDFDVAGETGGAKTSTAVVEHTHMVNVTDPGHFHLTQRYPTATGGSSGFTIDTSMSGTLADNTLPTKAATTGVTAATQNPAGSVASFSLMNPYVVVYMWQRTA